MRKLIWLSPLLAIASFVAAPGKAADEPDLIFKRSTVFKLLTPNDKLATYGLHEATMCFANAVRSSSRKCKSCAAAILSATCWSTWSTDSPDAC
jgi:hypothetical protein